MSTGSTNSSLLRNIIYVKQILTSVMQGICPHKICYDVRHCHTKFMIWNENMQ